MGRSSATDKARAMLMPIERQGSSPGPRVTAKVVIFGISARNSSRSKGRAERCMRLARSGTTPPNFSWAAA